MFFWGSAVFHTHCKNTRLPISFSSPSPATAVCACPDTFKSTLKDGKTVCSCPSGLSPTLKNQKKICLPPITLTSFTAVPTGIFPKPRQLGPDVEPSEPTEDGGNTAAVVVVLVFVAIVWVLCCIFVRCKKTKSGPEVRIWYVQINVICSKSRFVSGSLRGCTFCLLGEMVTAMSTWWSFTRLPIQFSIIISLRKIQFWSH